MNRISRTACILILGVAGAWGLVSAQTAPPAAPASPPVAFTGGVKLGAVNLVRIFDARDGCDQIRDLNVKLRVAREDAARESDQRRKSLDEAKMRVNMIPPTSADYAQARDQYNRLNVEFQVWAQTKKEELDGEEFRWMNYMYELVCAAAAAIAQEKGIDMVLTIEGFDPGAAGDEMRNLQAQIRGRKVVYAAPQTEMTQMIIDRLNRDYRARGGSATLGPSSPSDKPAGANGQKPPPSTAPARSPGKGP